jgi:hypothetical protein
LEARSVEPELVQFDHEWKHGDRGVARGLARAYIGRRRSELAPALEPYSLEDLVQLIDAYRAAGREDDRIIADMWLLTNYDPQRITGTINKTLDVNELWALVTAAQEGN